jgi:hypothetical protein
MSSLGRDTLDRLRLVSTATLTTQLFKRGLRNAFHAGRAPARAIRSQAGWPRIHLAEHPGARGCRQRRRVHQPGASAA